MITRVLAVYHRLLKRNKYVVQAIQVPLIMGTGDIITQSLVEKTNDHLRTVRFMVIGAPLGVMFEVWYSYLDRKMGVSRSLRSSVKKTIVDQLCCNPPGVLFVLTSIPLLEGKGWEGVKTTLSNDFTDVLINSYLVWPLVQVMNFRYVPSCYRVLYIAMFEVLWSSYLSWKTHMGLEKKIHEQEGL